jgi:GAF domain-containing protein
MGCDLAQGYFISRPLAEQDFAAWLAARASETPAAPGVYELLRKLVAQLGMDAAFVARFAGDRKLIEAFEGVERFGEVREGANLDRSESYCDRVTRGVFPNLIRDARADELTRDLPATRRANLGAYLGVPLHDDAGELYGTLCCISSGAREDLGAEQVQLLRQAAELLRPHLPDAHLSLARREQPPEAA